MTRALRPGARILALDLHPQRYGYAVLETPANLLDWGVRRGCRPRESKRPASMQRGLRTLLEIWRPSLVVVSEPSRHWTVRIRKRWADLLKRGAPSSHSCTTLDDLGGAKRLRRAEAPDEIPNSLHARVAIPVSCCYVASSAEDLDERRLSDGHLRCRSTRDRRVRAEARRESLVVCIVGNLRIVVSGGNSRGVDLLSKRSGLAFSANPAIWPGSLTAPSRSQESL